MRVFVTGGTGFVGPAIVRALVAEGHQATVLVHRDAGPFGHTQPGVATVQGDATQLPSFHDHVRGHDAVVHLVAIRREVPERGLTFERMHVDATRNVLEAARDAGVRRYLHMSAHGVRADGTGYQRTKWRAEEMVRASGLDWTIFRPTYVTGPAEEGGGTGFDHEFAEMARKGLAMPSFAGGDFRIQPVAKRDVAAAFARALANPATHGKAYELAGPDVLTWDEYLQAVCEAVGVRRPLVPVPRWAILPIAGALGGFSWFPVSRGEMEMLMEGAVADSSPAARDLDITFTPFRPALREAVQAQGDLGKAKRRRGLTSAA